MTQPTETTRLLDQDARPIKPASPSYLWKILPIALTIFVLDAAAFLSVGPETALFEKIACRKYYGTSEFVYGDRCKVEPVQSEVAFVIAWRQSLEIIPGILCAIPFGAVADRVGAKKVLVFAMCGCFMSDAWVRAVCYFPDVFPLRMVLVSGIFQFVGGGATTLSSMLWVMIADATPAEHRSSAFANIQATILISEFVSITLSAPLMTITPWLPYLLASGSMLTGFVIALVWIREVPRKEEEPASTTTTLKSIVQTTRWITQHIPVLLLLISFFTIEIGLQPVTVLVQYASKRYSWSIPKATYMRTIRSLSSLLLLLTMPFLTRLTAPLFHTRLHHEKRSTQLSLLFLLASSLASALAYHPALLIIGQLLSGLGSGYHVTARSLITVLVGPEHLGSLYGAVAVASYCGVLAGGPVAAAAFEVGLKGGGWALGMPFFVAAVVLVGTFGVVSGARVEGAEGEGEGLGGEM